MGTPARGSPVCGGKEVVGGGVPGVGHALLKVPEARHRAAAAAGVGGGGHDRRLRSQRFKDTK